jgi:hypothetical protein
MKLEETIRILYDADVEFVVKTAAGRPRDLYVLPELRALNEVKKKTGLD